MSLDAAVLEKLLGLALDRIAALEEESAAHKVVPVLVAAPPTPAPTTGPSGNRVIELVLDDGDGERVRRILNRILVDIRMAAFTLAKNRNRDLGARLTLDADDIEAIKAALPKKSKP